MKLILYCYHNEIMKLYVPRSPESLWDLRWGTACQSCFLSRSLKTETRSGKSLICYRVQVGRILYEVAIEPHTEGALS